MIEIKKFENIEYLIRIPENPNGKKNCPVIFFLHGAGGREKGIRELMQNQFFEFSQCSDEYIAVAPHCKVNSWFDIFETIKNLAKYIYSSDFTDRKRFYLMGVSMGGYGAWQLAMSLPEIFAAAVPICGGGMYWNAGRLKNVKIWAFHGQKDTCVFPDESQKMVDAINNRGGDAMLTIYPECAHNSWEKTYKNPEVFKWLLSQENKAENVEETIKYDQKNFG